ncbi:hypothetical protein KZ829_08865 [Actinoplanes hulinensis]|uniref:DUF3558 domain-containing protein n=1 Tax=Actinoplanes hulinensis TaxID=1144547 RepID=A0ABS7AYM2_9ACTN|nr:hypothetical protein [Actinoplanes hulinensis]MBW6433845.1 hypothetical protein [Actinoplanes hulinensis]
MERRSGSLFRGWPLFIIVVGFVPLLVLCGGGALWFFLPVFQGGERWTEVNHVCPVLDATVASSLGVVPTVEPPNNNGAEGPDRLSRCRYDAVGGGGSDVAQLDVRVDVLRPGQLDDAHEQALDVVEYESQTYAPLGEQSADQIFGEDSGATGTILMVTAIDNAVIKIEFDYPAARSLDIAGKTALRDPLQSVTDQAVANLG